MSRYIRIVVKSLLLFILIKYLLSIGLLPQQLKGKSVEQKIDKAQGYDVVKTSLGSTIQVQWLSFSKKSKNKKILIVFNPNAASKEQMQKALPLKELGARYGKVVFWDYPNTGGSKSGQWITDRKGLVDAAVAVAEYVADGKYDDLYFYGWSLGGAVAIEAAYELQTKGFVVEGLIIDRTFTSVSKYIRENMYIPEIIGDVFTYIFRIDFDNALMLQQLKAQNKKILYSNADEVLGSAILKSCPSSIESNKCNAIEMKSGHLNVVLGLYLGF